MVVTSTRAGKSKGQGFQKEIVQKLRKKFGQDKGIESCFEGNIQAQVMGMKGCDIKLEGAAKQLIPFDFELKRCERIEIWQWLKQTEKNAETYRIPLLVFRRNNSKTYAIIEFDKLLWLMD